MIIHSDWHIHSQASYDASLPLDEIARGARQFGFRRVGITDHTNYNDTKFIGDLDASAASVKAAQKEHPEFRVRTPLLSSNPITAHIGIREDVAENSKFEVLEVGNTSDGRTTYKRVAIIKPKKGKIWDNRYMAEFEEHKNGMLKSTEFELISGSISQTACLIREIDD